MGDSMSDDIPGRRQKKAKKKSSKKKKNDRHRCDSASSSSSDSSSTSRRKHKEKKAKKKAKKAKKRRDSSALSDSTAQGNDRKSERSPDISERLRLLAEPLLGPSVELAAVNEVVKPKGPMTKEQWEKHQTTLRRVHDPETGRTRRLHMRPVWRVENHMAHVAASVNRVIKLRLIRGDGEIMEEIVSRDMHIAINKAATKADGAYFETVLGLKRHK